MFWKRFRRGGGEEELSPEAFEAEEVASAAVSERLGRLVSRQREEETEAASGKTELATKLGEVFSGNAFLTLGVPMTATASDIHAAVDDLSFAEDVDPQALASAQAELLSPLDRLGHELGWLPGCDAELQKRACDALKAGDAEAIDTVRFAASGLARVNLGTAMLVVRPADANCMKILLADLARWEPHQSHAMVDEARLAAGIRPVEPAHFDKAADARRDAIARHIAQCAANGREGRLTLAQQIADNGGTYSAGLEAAIAAYARAVDPRLQAMQAKMDDAISSLQENPAQPAVLTSIISTLDQWSQLRLPLQRLEQARGLDDPLSMQLFDKVRDIGIVLSNKHKMAGETLRLVKALRQAFANVPGAQPIIERDLSTSVCNALGGRLFNLAEDAVRNLRLFASELRVQPFEYGTQGPFGKRLIDCFEQMHEADPTAEAPFDVVRQIAIALNNKASAPALAMQIYEFMLAHNPPVPIGPQLTQEMCQIQRNINKAER